MAIGGLGSVAAGGQFGDGAVQGFQESLTNGLNSEIIIQLAKYGIRNGIRWYARWKAVQKVNQALTVSRTPEDILMPGGQPVGDVVGRARPTVRTVSKMEYDQIKGDLLSISKPVESGRFPGPWYEFSNGSGNWGIRMSTKGNGETIHVDATNIPYNTIHYQ